MDKGSGEGNESVTTNIRTSPNVGEVRNYMKIRFKNILSQVGTFMKKHKKVSIFVFICFVVLGYIAYGKLSSDESETRYILAIAKKGTIVTTVSGSGQVSALNQVSIKPKVSGDIMWVGAKNGQDVRAGQALFSLDSTDAKKNVYDAEIALEEAKLQYQKNSAQAPIDYQRKLETLESQKDDLKKEYENTFNTVSDAFLNLPATMTGAEDALYGTNLSSNKSQWNVSIYKDMFTAERDRELVKSFADIAERDYKNARNVFDAAFLKFKSVMRTSSTSTIESALAEAYDAASLIAQALKSEKNLLDTVIDVAQKNNISVSAYITSSQSSVAGYLNTANAKVSSLLNEEISLENKKQAIMNTERDIAIIEINNPTGGNPISLQAELNSLRKKEKDLEDLRENLSNYTIYAPFSGIITNVSVEKNDSVSTGSVLATILTKGKIAEITLNEIDAARVKIGQKATLSFDAIENLSVVGEVNEVDVTGSVSQGVVTYKAKIGFDEEDTRIKSGMSVSTSIVIDAKLDVLMVPNSSVKKENNTNYVEIAFFSGSVDFSSLNSQGVVLSSSPLRTPIEMGISNDEYTEIVSGVSEGDIIVTRTISSSQSSQTQNTQRGTNISIPGLTGGIRR